MDWRKIESLDDLPRDVPFIAAWFNPDGKAWLFEVIYPNYDIVEDGMFTHWCPITPPEADI